MQVYFLNGFGDFVGLVMELIGFTNGFFTSLRHRGATFILFCKVAKIYRLKIKEKNKFAQS